jgi:hypothetical protein
VGANPSRAGQVVSRIRHGEFAGLRRDVDEYVRWKLGRD